MAEVPMLRGGADTTRFDDYIRAMLTKDWAALTAILTNTSGLLQNSLTQIKAISQIVQQNAATASAADTDATAKAVAAGASATAAKTSETNAGLSESQASTLAAQCTQIKSDVTDMKNVIDVGLRSFAKTWLGDLAEDPTQDQFGNALATGAEYYNTTNKVIRIYTADGKWEDVSADAQAATLSAQQILQQCQQIEAQIQNQYDTIMAQIGVAIRNDYGLSTGKYGLYAGLWDTTYTALGGKGAIAFVYKDTNKADVWQFLASQEDLTAETTARSAADTALENEKVNRSGDTIDHLTISKSLVIGSSVGAGTSSMLTEYYSTGTIAGLNAVTHLFDSSGNALTWMALNGGTGRIYTDRGTVAFLQDVTTETTARTAADTTLENEKVNRAGDTMVYLNSTGWIVAGYNSGWSGGTTTGSYRYTNGISFGAGTLNSAGSGALQISDVVGSETDGRSGIHMYGQDTNDAFHEWFFSWNGMITSPKGNVAFSADVTTETTARSAADTALENEKVNRSGDTMDHLTISNSLIMGSSVGAGTSSMLTEYYSSGWIAGLNAVTHLFDSSGTAMAWMALNGGNSKIYTKYGTVAFLQDITTETNARAAADTTLENEKVNRSGDTMASLTVNGVLNVDGSIGTTSNYTLFNNRMNTWVNHYIDPSNWITWDFNHIGGGNASGMRLGLDGTLETSKGIVALQTTITTSGDANTPGSYTIFKTRDLSSPSGWRYKICGISQQISAEGDFVVTFPFTLSGIYPGCYGATEYFYNTGNYESHDTTVSLVTPPTTSTMTLNCNQSGNPWVDYPISALWWIEGY